jgi:hypothetical protein
MAGHNHSRRAVAALKSVIFDECFLYRAQLTVLCQTLDSRYFAAIRLHREMETGFNDFTVEQHGAGAALADDAADVSAGETDILAEEMRQQQTGLDVFLVQAPVNIYTYVLFHDRATIAAASQRVKPSGASESHPEVDIALPYRYSPLQNGGPNESRDGKHDLRGEVKSKVTTTAGRGQIQKPEERELENKKAALAALEADLIQRELDLATLRTELASFENGYLGTVGILYAVLDQIEAQIAEAEARRRPSDLGAQEAAARARTQAEESFQNARAIGESKSKPTEGLKKLFREVAKLIHPDLATNDPDHARRQKLMAEANRAYAEGDEAKLQAILTEWETSPESVEGEGVGPELIRVIRKISQIQRRFAEIEAEMQQLKTADLYQLWSRTEEVKNQGRDLFKEMATQVEREIDGARKRLAAVAENSADT